ncbi:zinc-ribbon domain-containing protein [Desulfobacula phenolica]|uniref:MJ0042 family finger-like domain-containing protein n=1 Tax=Desulfobacula phenolica TaxID=90732 RepID=A0A1H2DWV7_9BACT|nr:zinc-ribbon domain-containing protein [Desulfobacula phenolica]SDT87331.1 MJ0042 family finger-like domain-containing protein [Desulfobacula phenolica]
MNVTCHNCKTKLNIPDHKIPKDKDLTLACPKCKEKIRIPVVKQQKSAQLSLEDRLNALVCIDDNDLKKKVVSIIGQMGLAAEIALDTKAALNKMEYHIYHLVIIDESFDQQKGISGMMDRMNSIDMSLRRRICLVLISDKFNTNDNMAALNTSVNSIIHRDDIIHLETFLSGVLADHKNFYMVYNDSLKLAGKA